MKISQIQQNTFFNACFEQELEKSMKIFQFIQYLIILFTLAICMASIFIYKELIQIVSKNMDLLSLNERKITSLLEVGRRTRQLKEVLNGNIPIDRHISFTVPHYGIYLQMRMQQYSKNLILASNELIAKIIFDSFYDQDVKFIEIKKKNIYQKLITEYHIEISIIAQFCAAAARIAVNNYETLLKTNLEDFDFLLNNVLNGILMAFEDFANYLENKRQSAISNGTNISIILA